MAAETKNARLLARRGSSRPVILIVEDNDDTRSILQDYLTCAGFTVDAASDGPTGLSMIRAGRRPDAVILDLSLPGMSGLEVLARMRTDEPTRDVPVLVFTGHCGTEMAERARQHPRVRLLGKPARPSDVVAAIWETIGSSSADDGDTPPGRADLVAPDPPA